MEAGPVPDSGFPFFVPSDLLHASRRRVRFFCFRRIAPLRSCARCLSKTGSAGLFFVPGESLRSEVAPVACRETGGCGSCFFVSGGLVPCRSIGLPMAGVRGCDGIARIAPNGLLSGLNRFVKHCPTALKPVAERGYVMKLLNIFKIFLKYLHNSKHPRIFAVKF